MDLKHKNVIYVGGFGGIGFASCKSFLAHNIANLMIMDLIKNEKKLQELKTTNPTVNVEFIELDLTDVHNIEIAFAQAHHILGHFDVVVNGSGIMNEQQIERTVQINLFGVIHSTLNAMRYMDKSKGGRGGLIVNLSSIVGLDAYGGYCVYTATKYGVNGFTRALADPFYYEKTSIGFITICPATTETPMIASLRLNHVTTFDERPPLPPALCNNQTAEKCGQNLVEAVKIGKNGSVWILCNGQLNEYHYPDIMSVLNKK